jgi:hypothetical protein
MRSKTVKLQPEMTDTTIRSMSWDEYLRSRRDQFERNVDNALRILFQQKHLYQTVAVAATNQKLVTKDGKTTTEALQEVTPFVNGPWSLDTRPPLGNIGQCFINAPDVKLFCSTCDRLEPFNRVFADELFRRIRTTGFESKAGETEQIFVFGYVCQSCKGTPEIFLIRRRGLRLTNEGRSPMERVSVPPAVPKTVRQFFRGAVVAHQSGR